MNSDSQEVHLSYLMAHWLKLMFAFVATGVVQTKYVQNMRDYDRMRLWEVCFNRSLFRIELERIVRNTSRHDILAVIKYCYDKYSDKHADLLFDVFSGYLKTNRKDKLVHPTS